MQDECRGSGAQLRGGPADDESVSDVLCNCPCHVSTSMSLAGHELGPCLLPGGPGMTSDALSSSKVLRGEDEK